MNRVPIKNIYFLLCYAWGRLQEGGMVKSAAEEANTPVDLLALVLVSGIRRLLKLGLERQYGSVDQSISGIKGKVIISETIRSPELSLGRVRCRFDEFHSDTAANQILKATLRRLLQVRSLEQHRLASVLSLYRRFGAISDKNIEHKDFSNVIIHRHNRFYRFLIDVCRMIHDNLLPGERSGELAFRDFIRDESQMPMVFENFIRNFLKIHQSDYQVGSEHITWSMISSEENQANFLPIMKTDISLRSKARRTIIETKFYRETMSSRPGYPPKIHSQHLYQLCSYLKNVEAKDNSGIHASGILLYPSVGIDLDLHYEWLGHAIHVRTINLATDWKQISQRLLDITSMAE